MEWLLLPFVGWAVLLTALLPTKGFYKSIFDRATLGKYRDDRNGLQIMLNHLTNHPEEWSLSREAASFPLKGAKQIYLTFDEGKWNYTLTSAGDRARVLDGHYGAKFGEAIAREVDRRNAQSLMRALYNTDGPLLLK